VFARAPEEEQEVTCGLQCEAGKNSGNTGGSGTSGSTSTNTSGGTSTGAASAPGVASSPQAVEELELGCSRRALVLDDVLISGSRVELVGSAAKRLDGKKVTILFAGHERVASATVGADGQFSTTAPLPPRRLRDGNGARYVAVSGDERSLDLKLTRRLILEPPRVAGDTVTLVGEVVPPLTKPVSSVSIEQQLECGRTAIVGHVTPAANGSFRVSLTVPTNARAGLYRLTGTVRENVHSRKGFATYSLPLPALLG
jgi:hypothetical protein